MTFQLMTAVALDFCAEELELRGGREVGRSFENIVFDFVFVFVFVFVIVFVLSLKIELRGGREVGRYFANIVFVFVFVFCKCCLGLFLCVGS